ncbi:serine threonine protein kinase [Stylonychia lemnae]|uniref:Serine threonine protein kinase n=1 Tax=Stylonychia lemnae TaxID=5949 RepID=A0A078ALX9_STYLE|nr:serine threonine protein kinase [Stylonychia lemnae]|eukprot:CDW82402.1 serine threonine protein kinase [Stylonychia lemnae]
MKKKHIHRKNQFSVQPLTQNQQQVDQLIDEVFNDGTITARNSPDQTRPIHDEFQSFIQDDQNNGVTSNDFEYTQSALTKNQRLQDYDDEEEENQSPTKFRKISDFVEYKKKGKPSRKQTTITDSIMKSGKTNYDFSKQDKETQGMLTQFMEVDSQLKSYKEHVQKLKEFKNSEKLKFLGTHTWFVYSDVLYNIEIKQGEGFIGSYKAEEKMKIYSSFYSDNTPNFFKDESNNDPIPDFKVYQEKSVVSEWGKYIFQLVLYTIPTLEKVGTLNLPLEQAHQKVVFRVLKHNKFLLHDNKQFIILNMEKKPDTRTIQLVKFKIQTDTDKYPIDNVQNTFLVSYIGKNELMLFGYNYKYHINLVKEHIQMQQYNIQTTELNLIHCGEFLMIVSNSFKIDKVFDIEKKDFIDSFDDKEDISQFICNSPNTICNKGLIINKKSLFKVEKQMKKLDIEPQLLENFNNILPQTLVQYDSYNNQIYFYVDRSNGEGKDLFRVHLCEREHQVTHPIMEGRYATSPQDIYYNYIQDDYLICCFMNVDDDSSKYLEVIKFDQQYQLKMIGYEPFEMKQIEKIQKKLSEIEIKKCSVNLSRKHLLVNFTGTPKQNQSYLSFKDTFVDKYYVTNCDFMQSEIVDIPAEQLNLQYIQLYEKSIFTSYIKQCENYLWDFNIPEKPNTQINLVAFDKDKKQSFSFKIYENEQEIKRVHLSECLSQIIIIDINNQAKIFNVEDMFNDHEHRIIDDFITLVRFSPKQFVYIQKDVKLKRYFLKFCEIQEKAIVEHQAVSLDQYIKDIQLFEKLDILQYKQYESQSLVVRDKFLMIDLYEQYLIYDLRGKTFMGKIQIQNQKRAFSLTYQLNQLTLSMDNPKRKGKKMYYVFEGFLESYFRLNYGQFDVAYDLDECLIIFKDFSNQPIGVVSFQQDLQLQIDQIELVDVKKSDSFAIQKINKMSFREIANYIDPFNGTLLHIVAGKSDIVVNAIRQRLSNQQNQHDYMLFVNNEQGLSPLDYYVINDDYQKINFALDLMVRFQNHSMFNSIIDKNLIYLISKNFDLKEYLNSKLPICSIETSYYPQYSKDPATFYISEFDQTSSLATINYFYKDEVKKHVKKNEEGSTHQIEYLLPMIPISFADAQFMQVLEQSNNEDLFESELIQIVLSFKWDKYAFKFHLLSFLQFFVFLVNFIVDIYFLVLYEDDRSFYQQWALKVIGAAYIFFQIQYEIKTILVQGILSYLSEYWNYVDIFLILLYAGSATIDLMHVHMGIERLLYSICLIFVFIKFFSYLRIFQGFSFLVQMLRAVFVDLKFFIALYGIVIVLYGLIFTLLEIKTDEDNIEYEGISYFGYYIMSFRASTGDFQVDNFHNLDKYHVQFAWIIWVTSVLFLNIILLNFIIAVISQSYEKIMQRMVAQSYMAKAKLIYECELHYSRYGKGDSHFPKYFILRRVKNNTMKGEDAEWQGFVKDIKKSIEKVKVQLTEKQDTSTQKIYKKLEDFRNQIQANNEEGYRIVHEDLNRLKSAFKKQDKFNKKLERKLFPTTDEEEALKLEKKKNKKAKANL